VLFSSPGRGRRRSAALRLYLPVHPAAPPALDARRDEHVAVAGRRRRRRASALPLEGILEGGEVLGEGGRRLGGCPAPAAALPRRGAPRRHGERLPSGHLRVISGNLAEAPPSPSRHGERLRGGLPARAEAGDGRRGGRPAGTHRAGEARGERLQVERRLRLRPEPGEGRQLREIAAERLGARGACALSTHTSGRGDGHGAVSSEHRVSPRGATAIEYGRLRPNAIAYVSSRALAERHDSVFRV